MQSAPPDPRLESEADGEDNIIIIVALIVSIMDTMRAIKKSKNNKAPGKDNLPGELFKYGEEQLAAMLHKLILQIWSTEKTPKEWLTSIICIESKLTEYPHRSRVRGGMI
ncbi:hypothetical protein J437_LFUL005487 [Ladona fulva]|uniref:Uncharacterized protein n=1 Tax=Ladona fulva TaxID=123851 RepID=A0A8K0K2A7_LADFU|nr:hypothetical protein J437_LFUL005487 [Ladona fulva]